MHTKWERAASKNHSHGTTRYQIFKAQQSKQCKKLHAERIDFRDFLKCFFYMLIQHAASLAAMSWLPGSLSTEVVGDSTYVMSSWKRCSSPSKKKQMLLPFVSNLRSKMRSKDCAEHWIRKRSRVLTHTRVWSVGTIAIQNSSRLEGPHSPVACLHIALL